MDLIDQACEVLRHGGVILYPTDTIWGLGCDATNKAAVEKVALLKHRPDNKSFIILVSDTTMLARYVVEIPEIAYQLLDVAAKPLTIIYPNGDCLPEQVLGQDGSVAIRIPRHEYCQTILHRLRRPLLSTSVNLSGEKAPSRFEQIDSQWFDKVDWTAPQNWEKGATGGASSILKLGLQSEIQIIRP